MAYSFKASDQSVEDGMIRIAIDQIDTALEELGDASLTIAERAYQVRKRCKKIRGLARLVKPGFAEYSEANRRFREIARSLSDLRDDYAILESFDVLVAQCVDAFQQDGLTVVRAWLIGQCRQRAGAVGETRLTQSEADLHEARKAVGNWSLEEPGLKAAMAGMARTYRRARRNFAKLRPDADPGVFHEWRKHVKYHWYHARLCKRIAPDQMELRIVEIHRLARWLGEHHDLTVLRASLDRAPKAVAAAPAFATIQEVIERRRIALEVAALESGERLFAEKPRALARRWQVYWTNWREGDVPIDELSMASGPPS